MSNETYRSKIVILGTEIQRGQSVNLDFEVAKLHTRNTMNVPILVERAKEDGPVLLLMAGVHGDEINGVEIIRKIIRSGINKPIKGTIVCIPVLNIFGFLSLTREFPDGRDLNRVFPGTEKGSLASQFAHMFLKEIIPHVDYVLDFHTGSADRVNIAQTRCSFDDKESFELAKVFDAPVLVHSKYIAKSLRDTLRKRNITSVLFEGGKSRLYDHEAIEIGIQGAKNVIQHLDMSKGNPIQTKSILIRKSKWMRAPYSGMFHLNIKNGSWVKKKQLMGLITDPFGDFEKKIYAPFDCYIYCINMSAIVNRGDALFHISVEVVNE